MAIDVYGTGTTIVNAALENLPVATGGAWPSTTTRIAWVNDGMLEAQRLTLHYKERESQTFAQAATYYEFTLQDPSLFALLECTVSGVRQQIIDYPRMIRERAAAATLADNTWYFASNRIASATFGTVRVEVYPAVDADTGHPTGVGTTISVELLYATAPPRITALANTAYIPRDILEMYVAWRAALARRPEKAHVFRAAFEKLCLEARMAGGLADQLEDMATTGIEYGSVS